MPIAIDAVSSAGGAGAGPFTFSHTCTGSDRLLYAGVVYYISSTNELSALTYNGDALSLVTNGSRDAGSFRLRLMRLIAPDTGANTVSLEFSGSGVYDMGIMVISLTGVDQTTPCGVAVTNDGYSTDPESTVVSDTDQLVLDAMMIVHSGALSVDAGQTSRWNAIAPNGYVKYAGSSKTGAASTTMGWLNGSNQNWIHGTVAILPVGGGGGGSFQAAWAQGSNVIMGNRS